MSLVDRRPRGMTHLTILLSLSLCLSTTLLSVPAAAVADAPDQVNDPSPQGSVNGTFICQSFVPSKRAIDAADLRFSAGGSFPVGGLATMIGIRTLDVSAPDLTTAVAFIGGPLLPGQSVLVHFVFARPVAVTPGTTYLIRWNYEFVPSAVLNWAARFDDPYSFGNLSPSCDGTPFPSGPLATADLNFVTYAPLDATPPALTLPSPITVNATSPAGASVSYSVSATDPDDASSSLTIGCAPASGSFFPIGVTSVRCDASDLAGNTTTGSFAITVLGATDQLTNLIQVVDSLDLRTGVNNSLDVKLQQAVASLNAIRAHDNLTACNALTAFMNEVRAQTGESFASSVGAALLAAASDIEAALPCG